MEEEIVFLFFIGCQFANQVWTTSDLGWYTLKISSFVLWLEKLFRPFDLHDQAGLALHTVWTIWGATLG
ncbi:unnamed protein product [Cuscuta campestris]|uniref:Uncharacterized protein n=1 Tax=Cuscuta campestris TaxID=132261 RepID=A0A484MDA8_9ASTE|nr:unnamed protein product [Cuscuta campestris]